jgi:hypothetical protein
VRPQSRDVKFKEGEFLLSLMPESAQAVMLNWRVHRFKNEFSAVAARVQPQKWDYRDQLRKELKVQIRKFDRPRGILIVKAEALVAAAIEAGVFDLDFNAQQRKFGIVDEVVQDFFTMRLKRAFEAIKTPPLALAQPLFPDPTIARLQPNLRPRVSASVPADIFL